MSYLLLQGDSRRIPLADRSVHAVVTSPPYFNQRDYGSSGQIGREETPSAFVAALVVAFREVRRVLRDDGSIWVNMGDSFNSAASNQNGGGAVLGGYVRGGNRGQARGRVIRAEGLKPKDLIGIPWMLAFALRDDGWHLRMENIWCLSGGTWVYAKTQKGEMPVMISDLVRLRPETVQLWNGSKWTQVLGWNRSPDPEQRLELVLRSGERIGCTGNHQWPTQRGNVRAAEIKVGDVIRSCNLPESPAYGRPQYLTDDALWFAGLYLAEGSMSEDTIQIAGHADEAERFSRIESLARHYGGSATFTVDGNNLSIRVYSRVLRAILETYIGGRSASDKHLKVATWALPHFSLKSIALGYLEGDGHKDPRNNRVRLGFCRNYALERDLRVLAARLGAILTLNPVVVTSQWGKYPAFKGEWRWERSGHRNEKDRGEIVAIRNSKGRHFYDIGVADEPHLFSLASGILTHNSKPNPMPESVTDRPSRSHEHLFLLTKGPRYFYDAEAVKVPGSPASAARHAQDVARQVGSARAHAGGKTNGNLKAVGDPDSANLRSVWTVPVRGTKVAHFATMPTRLVVPCVKAGTSLKGCCPRCGAPWRRIVAKTRMAIRPGVGSKVYRVPPLDPASPHQSRHGDICGNRDPRRHVTTTRTVGWESTCGHMEARYPIPCRVLDPFVGSGTTIVVAEALGRSGIGLDLSADYLAIARRRITRPHAPVRVASSLDPAPAREPLPGQLNFLDSMEAARS